MIIDLTEYLERRRRTAEVGVMARTVSRHGSRAPRQSRLGSAVRWSGFLPMLPALELAALYADASLI